MQTPWGRWRGETAHCRRLACLTLGAIVSAACGDSGSGVAEPPDGGAPFVPAYTTIYAGARHSCALDEQGVAFCWGSNGDGQIGGIPASEAGLLPVRLPGELRYASMALGLAHTCGLAAETLYCWGETPGGSLALTPREVPSDLALAGADSRFDHVCGVLSDRRAYCLGSGNEGQLGNGEHGDAVVASEPVVVEGLGDVVSVVTGVTFSCGLDGAGRAWCWGAHDAGALGIGTVEPGPCESAGVPYACSTTPTPVDADSPWVDLAAGYYHVCALTSEGSVFCWGDQQALQAGASESPETCSWATPGAPDRSCHRSPVRVDAAGLRFVSIHAGGFHSCGLTESGDAFCWGSNSFGQLGSPGPSPDGPRAVEGGLSWRTLAMGQIHTCGVTTSARAFCWGGGAFRQLGTLLESSFMPVEVLPPIV